MVGHFGESILRGVGLADWVARDDETFVSTAVALTKDPAALAGGRAGLRGALLASPLCSRRSFVQSFEETLERLWEARQ